MLGVYVELQAEITQRRIAEFEAQQKAAEAKVASEIADAAKVAYQTVDVNTTNPAPDQITNVELSSTQSQLNA